MVWLDGRGGGEWYLAATVPLLLPSLFGGLSFSAQAIFLQGQIRLSDSEIQTSEDSLSSDPVTLTGTHVLPPH